MPSQININPLRAFGADGKPSAGAKATFSETGTTTPLTVYTDSTLATAHPTPLVADGQGVFPTPWTDGATAVKVTVTDASDVVLNGYPMDPVQLVASTGSAAASVSFTPVTGNPGTDVQEAIEHLTTANNTAQDLGATSPFASAADGDLAKAAAPRASPALSGTPTAPTATTGTATTQIATTAFVATEVAALRAPQTVADITGTTAHSTSYQNSTSKAFHIYAVTSGAGAVRIQTSPNGSTWTDMGVATSGGFVQSNAFWVAAGHYWRINGTATVDFVQKTSF